HPDPRLQHVHEHQPDGHGDVLQDGPGRPDEEPAAPLEPLRDRTRADRPPRPGRRPDLRGPDQLQRADLRRGEEDRLEGRHRRVLAHLPLERAPAAGAEVPAGAAARAGPEPGVRVLVTGAGGMLARAVREEFARRGHDVVALDRAALDVTDEAAVRRALHEHRPAAVLHCAAYTRVDDAEAEEALAFAVNAEAARHVARACREVGARFVYPSTDYVLDGRAATPYHPEAPTSPLNAYGRSKRAGEAAAAEAGDHLVVRTSWLFDGRGRNFVTTILERARRGERL